MLSMTGTVVTSTSMLLSVSPPGLPSETLQVSE